MFIPLSVHLFVSYVCVSNSLICRFLLRFMNHDHIYRFSHAIYLYCLQSVWHINCYGIDCVSCIIFNDSICVIIFIVSFVFISSCVFLSTQFFFFVPSLYFVVLWDYCYCVYRVTIYLTRWATKLASAWRECSHCRRSLLSHCFSFLLFHFQFLMFLIHTLSDLAALLLVSPDADLTCLRTRK